MFIQHFTKMLQKIKRKEHKFVHQNIVFLLFYPINHLMTPQIYLTSLWRGLSPKLGTTELNYLTVYSRSPLTSNNSKMFIC